MPSHTEEEKQKKLDRLLSLLDPDNALSKKDFESAFQKVIILVQEILKKHEMGIQELQEVHETLMQTARDETGRNLAGIKGQVNDVFVGDRLKEMAGKNDMSIAEMKKMLADGFADLSDGQKKELFGLKDGVSKTAEKKIRELDMGMRTIEDENKGEIDGMLSAFKEDVKKDLRELKEMLGKVAETRSRGGGRKVPMTRFLDLSSDVSGSATTFNLPPDTVRVFGVWSTQFPGVFNTTDWSRSGRVLTLNFTLQSGQSLIVAVETLFYA